MSAACKTLGEGGSQRYARPRGLRPRAPLYAHTRAKCYSIKSLRLMFPQVGGERRPCADSRTILARSRSSRRRNAKPTQRGLSTTRAEPHAARPASAMCRAPCSATYRQNVGQNTCGRDTSLPHVANHISFVVKARPRLSSTHGQSSQAATKLKSLPLQA